jgi:uncharacterized protein DUF1761
MSIPQVNLLAVLVAGVLIFVLGGIWYSALFRKPWMRLMGKSEEEIKASAPSGGAMATLYLMAFVCALAIAFAMAVILNHFEPVTFGRAAAVGVLCWLGFAAPTSFATAVFSMTPKPLWLINSGYNLASFVLAAVLLAAWR